MATSIKNGIVRIGCAGWSTPAQHAQLFAADGSGLARYASRFNVVEINSSFHRSHQRKTYERWAESVPAGFRFAAKLPKTITHEQRLQQCASALDRFGEELGGLGRKLGGVLVQLPPSLVFDARVANTFFAMLRRRFDVGIACEPRHASWFSGATDSLWARYDIARVAADPAPVEAAAQPAGKGKWRYWRWHGSPRMYYSSYDDARLRELAEDLLKGPARQTSWVIFDNTAHGHAANDAARLQGFLDQV